MTARSAYTASTLEMAELFADYLEGDTNRPALAVSNAALSEDARNALEKSFEAFGFESPTCSYVTLAPHDASVEGGNIRLDAQALFLLIESLDPLFVIAADERAAVELSKTYRCSFPPDSPIRVFGRSGVAFSDLHTLLSTDLGKRKAWTLLKSLS